MITYKCNVCEQPCFSKAEEEAGTPFKCLYNQSSPSWIKQESRTKTHVEYFKKFSIWFSRIYKRLSFKIKSLKNKTKELLK